MAKAKVGATHVAGMLRKGFSELAQYLPAFNNSGAHVIEDAAIWPNVTPGEISQARAGPDLGPEQESVSRPMSLQQLRAHAAAFMEKAENRMENGNAQEHGGLEM